ncbi:MAG: tRNA pseudouridine(55) synthase TruB, partial [Sideroxyarcus sp.]|nr:tRNA pseudouridine(55) synthase TruB [Sideroxyarcus sp.]
ESMDAAQRDACLMPLDRLVQELPSLELDSVQANRLAQGQKLGLSDGHPDGKRRLYAAGRFIGLGDLSGGRLVPIRLLSGVAKAAAQRESA